MIFLAEGKLRPTSGLMESRVQAGEAAGHLARPALVMPLDAQSSKGWAAVPRAGFLGVGPGCLL